MAREEDDWTTCISVLLHGSPLALYISVTKIRRLGLYRSYFVKSSCEEVGGYMRQAVHCKL